MAAGFVKLPYEVIDRYGDRPEKLAAFIWLLRSRDYKTGDVLLSVRELAERYGWSVGKSHRFRGEVVACSVGLLAAELNKSGTLVGTANGAGNGTAKRTRGKSRTPTSGPYKAGEDETSLGSPEIAAAKNGTPNPSGNGTPGGIKVEHQTTQIRENTGLAGPLDVDVVDKDLTATTTPLGPPVGDDEIPTKPADPVPANSKPKRPRKRTPPPAFADFEITDRMREWFRGKGWKSSQAEVHLQTEAFLDSHRSKGNLMADWTAAWRTWMTNWQTNFGKGTTPRLPIHRQYQQRPPPPAQLRAPNDPVTTPSADTIGLGLPPWSGDNPVTQPSPSAIGTGGPDD